MVFKEVGNEPTEEWKPTKVGEFLEGIYAKKKTEVGEHKSNLYIFDVNGERKSIWGSKVLDDRMDDIKINIGDTLRITYEGDNETPKYHKYKVEKDYPEENTEEQPVE